jgi:uncharacterized membrane protein YccC
MDGVLKLNGLVRLNLQTAKPDYFFGWQGLWEAWPVTLIGSMVGCAITIWLGIAALTSARNADHRRQITDMTSRLQQAKNMAATARENAVKAANHAANQRVANREQELSRRESEVSERESRVTVIQDNLVAVLEQKNLQATAEANARVAARESALLPREQAAQTAIQQAERMQREAIAAVDRAEQDAATAIAAAQAEVDEEKRKSHSANAAFKRLSIKVLKLELALAEAQGLPPKADAPPKAKAQKTNPPPPTSAPKVEHSDEMPSTQEGYTIQDWLDGVEPWEKVRLQTNKKKSPVDG